jgi:very-short-patch-repair endonuclease
LALEYDGAQHRENLTGDNRRQNRLVDAGYRLLRFAAADVLSAPDSVVGLVRRALSAGTNQSRASNPARSTESVSELD